MKQFQINSIDFYGFNQVELVSILTQWPRTLEASLCAKGLSFICSSASNDRSLTSLLVVFWRHSHSVY